MTRPHICTRFQIIIAVVDASNKGKQDVGASLLQQMTIRPFLVALLRSDIHAAGGVRRLPRLQMYQSRFNLVSAQVLGSKVLFLFERSGIPGTRYLIPVLALFVYLVLTRNTRYGTCTTCNLLTQVHVLGCFFSFARKTGPATGRNPQMTGKCTCSEEFWTLRHRCSL